MLMVFHYPERDATIAALPMTGYSPVSSWFSGVRKRVAEIHSTAPVVEEDEEKQEIVFKPETASWMKIARLRAGKFTLWMKVCRMRRKSGSFSVFTLATSITAQ
ncbi:hypothetical protein ACLBOM_19995 [Escherichia coli]